ncbi:MAG: TrkA family potassium uptake protein [Puniceicoccales bacterium]|jgi:trk system potassium uptake protein TrkA|nr:TrkA family potassium uptake protein [Puniceicoccales bacterium]
MKCCIIGLGVFGKNLTLDLAKLGAEVVVIDPREENVSQVKDEASAAYIGDFSDTSILDKIPIREMDAVVIAIGDDFEKSISLTIKAQEMRAKRLVCRVLSPLHERLLRLLKVDRLVVPEEVAARGLAHSLLMRGVVEGFDMGNGYSIIEAKVPGLKGTCLQEKGAVFKRADVRIVTIKRLINTVLRNIAVKGGGVEKRSTLGVPSLDEVFQEDDIFVLFGREKKLRIFLEEYAK